MGAVGGAVAELELFVVVAVGDHVGVVAETSAGHRHVQRSRERPRGNDGVSGVDGASLGTGDRGCAGQLDVLGCVADGGLDGCATSGVSGLECAVVEDAGDSPDVAVQHPLASLVASSVVL